MVVAAFGMTGVYYTQQEKKQEEELAREQKEQIQQAKAEDAAREKAKEEAAKEAAEKREAAKEKEEKEKEEQQETEAVSGIIPPEEDDFMDEPAVVAETQAPAEPEYHFDAAADLNWPLQGNVVLNYSMDQTVYFATLDQYKYNPAVIIQADVNTPVKAVAAGKVTSVETNAETGTTMTVDMGDGYSAIYGQLKESPKNQGDYVEAGETLGYVSEPTKYYSVEGANLYFELQKDGSSVNPMEYLQ
ncbi:MAG: M23 family metallopeptidase [Lachnospiraceae bacterium]|nr:M23 family metallopeptidase [Lachnospiraceae bacterium]